MRSDKNRRIEIMDRLFRQGAPVSFMDVAEEMNKVLNGRKLPKVYADYYGDTFRKDMKTIRDVLDDPINGISPGMLRTAGGNRNRTYWYADANFSIMPYLDYYYNNSDFKRLDKALKLLHDTLPEEVFNTVEFTLKSRVEYEFGKGEKNIDYGENLRLKGRHWLPILYQAVNNQALEIVYKPYAGQKLTFTLFPYLLKQYNNRWFLFGRIEKIEKRFLSGPSESVDSVNPNYWNLPLDRIENITVLQDKPFVPRPDKYTEPFKQIIGTTNKSNDHVETIRFLVHGSTGHYIETKPLHISQVSKWIDENTLEVTLQVKINYELKRLLFSYVDSITLLEPKSLAEELKDTLKQALEQYERKQ